MSFYFCSVYSHSHMLDAAVTIWVRDSTTIGEMKNYFILFCFILNYNWIVIITWTLYLKVASIYVYKYLKRNFTVYYWLLKVLF